MKILVHSTWWHRHWPTIAVIVLCVATATAILSVYNQQTTTLIAQQAQQTKVMISTYDTQIAALKSERAAKLEAQHAAAVKAAEESKSATADSSSVISCANNLNAHGDPTRVDVVVNKSHCINPINYAPADLTSINGYDVSAKIAPSLQAMMTAAAAAGAPFGLTSSYRSYANQVTTYSGWVATNGSAELADTVSARPGYSEHQTGFAVDLDAGSCALECFATTPQYAWLQEHAAEFGFIQRYYDGFQSVTGYSPEAWHYRFVGPTVAQDMKARGIKTLEQYWGISGGNYPS